MVSDRCIRRLHEIVALPTSILRGRIDIRLRVQHLRLSEHTTIPDQPPVTHFEGVAGKPNEPLHEVLGRIFGPLEDDDVAILWLPQLRQPPMRERHLGAISQLVHEKKIADEKRPFHTSARNLERLDEERAEKKEEDDRDSEDLEPLPQERQRSRAAVHAAQSTDALFGCDRPGGRRRRGGSCGLGHSYATTKRLLVLMRDSRPTSTL